MGHVIAKQPDGKLAVFSTVVDSWILFDGTAEEIAELEAQKAYESCYHEILTYAERVQAGAPLSYHQRSFEQLDAVSDRHGGRLVDVQREPKEVEA